MKEHPIESLMEIAMNNIQDMVDVNTIIGEPIYVDSNITIIPVSKVSFGFVAGGSEFKGEAIEEYNKKDRNNEEITYKNPFGGGSGAGVNITPISFLVVNNGNIKLIHLDYCSSVDKIIDFIPDILNRACDLMGIDKEDEETMKQTIKYTYTDNKNDEDDE